jgi:acetylornithine/N-succinyldiaminopimelate aminotransferase
VPAWPGGRRQSCSIHLIRGFEEALAEQEYIVDIRGKGLMIGIELDRPCGELVGQALERGLLINVTADNTVRLLPPLVLSDDEAEQLVSSVTDLINEFVANGGK